MEVGFGGFGDLTKKQRIYLVRKLSNEIVGVSE